MTTEHALTVPAPRAAGCPFDLPQAYQQAAVQGPAVRVATATGGECWLITHHEEARAVLGDRRFSSDAMLDNFPLMTEELRKMVSESRSTTEVIDDQEHIRRRRILTAEFKAKKVEALRPQIQQTVDDALDEMITAGSPADLVSRFALPVPSAVICLLLGVPAGDHDFFMDRSHTMLDFRAGPEAMMKARLDLMEYMNRLTAEKKQQPDDRLISDLLASGALPEEEVAGTGLLLLLAGHETTSSMLAMSTLALLRHPEQLALLREDPSLIKGAVEELLRYITIVQNGVGRVALEDVEVGGQLIRAGEGVLCMVSTANRDESVFPGGEDLDVRRDARSHLSFGFGIHQCVGQSLARAELQIALETLLRRLPTLRLAVPVEDLRFRDGVGFYGVEELPVEW
ncbi:cytochrome P450 [Streptomyces sp. S.PNR 29]|uniref:cytochrome P450 n=1 Tax=Streptomyces sp. S.PNR 29 TaxID=2973805 RepID=UPI0025B15E0B|nr:cytochrome P450 [Streptomyces sp. S.PNR 29]MDN0195761.1 cytochrome P450 [Streptomyces sp. S.PNR 29]